MVAVTFGPDWVSAAFQIWVTCWFPGNIQVTVHAVTGLPRLVTDTLAVKPPDHWLPML